MRPLDWYAAKFNSHGSTVGQGAMRVLGRPTLDPLTVLVRETVQNSWDARLDGARPSYELSLRDLDPGHHDALRNVVFGDSTGRDLGIDHLLGDAPVRVLEISDRNTHGLVGPVRADERRRQGEATDFIDFVFNIGAPRDKEHGGGTYGFGKTISYLVSSCSTIVIASLTDEGEMRLIASGISDDFSMDASRYTGRQWWGRNAPPQRIEPLTGHDAERLSASLGMPAFTAPGTTIMILDPRSEEHEDDQSMMRFLGDSVLWHVWPKMVSAAGDRNPAMDISCRLHGRPFQLPDPAEHPRLRHFVAALQMARQRERIPGEGLKTALREIRIQRPVRLLGHLGLVQHMDVLEAERPEDGTGVAPFDGPSHHVALLRRVELVVKYLPGPQLTTGGFAWSGAFLTDPQVDDLFAKAEPPAHDDWQPDFLDHRTDKSCVRVGLRRIREETQSFVEPRRPAAATDSLISAGRIARKLWDSVPPVLDTPGESASGSGRTRAKRATGAERAIVELRSSRLHTADDDLEMLVAFSVSAPGARKVKVTATADVRLDTGRESAPPEGSRPPRVVRLERDDGSVSYPRSPGVFDVVPGDWELIVSCSEPTAVEIDIRAERIA